MIEQSNEGIEIMEESIFEMKKYLPKIIEASHAIVQKFQTSKEQQAIELFIYFSEGLEWLLQVADLTKQFQKSININLSSQKIHEILPEMIEGWNNKDYILISDLIEYEIIPIFEQWNNELFKLEG